MNSVEIRASNPRPATAIALLTRVCNRAFEERYSGANGHKRRARARLDEELALIDEIGQVMRDASICGLGQLAANAVDSAIHRLKLFEGGAA